MEVIKNVGKGAESIIEARTKNGKFTSIFDLCKSVDLRIVNKKCLESLICAGAFDSVPGTRGQLFETIDKALEYGGGFQKDRISGQVNLFDNLFLTETTEMHQTIPEPQLAAVEPWPYNLLLQKEKEILGFYVSGHPLDRYYDEVKGFSSISLKPEALVDVKDSASVTVGGMITSLKTHTQRDGRPMAFLELEEFDGNIELLIFGDAYEKFKHLLAVDAMVLVHGQISKREGEDKPKLRVDNCISLSESREKLTKSIHIRLNTQGLEKEFIQDIYKQCNSAQGECALILHLLTAERNEYRIKAKNIRVVPDPEIIRQLRNKIGKENVWLGKTAA
jgi:DNA polymerase-3 subunit alpha